MTFILPKEVFEQHAIVLGKTGSGKSSVMRLMVEHLLDDDKPVCIIDPKGDWNGLRVSADGKEAGYPIVIFGGDHADVPINQRSGTAVAELAATGNRPCIIDLGGWMPGARSEFYLDFASTFFRLAKGRRWLVIDEVHNFAPQGKVLDPQAGKVLHWSNRLASEGRGRGITLIAASQRPQKVHKDFVTSAETLVAMRVIHPLDRGAIKEWIDGSGDAAHGIEVLHSIASMQRGEGWVWSPEIGFGPKRIEFPMFSTYDSFKPQAASSPAKLKGWADVDLDEVKKKLEAVVKEAEANDPAKLKAKIRELEQKIAAGSGTAKIVTVTKPDGAFNYKYRLLEEDYERLRTYALNLEIYMKQLRAACEGSFKDIGSVLNRMTLDNLTKPQRSKKIPTPNPKKEVIPRARPVVDSAKFPGPHTNPESESDLPVGEQAILTACAQYPDGLERTQLTVLTGYKRSSRDAYIQRLHAKSYVKQYGGRIFASDAGIAALGSNYKPLPSPGHDLQVYWLNKLPEGERKILGILLDAHGSPVERETLTEATGYQRSTRDAYIQRMAARGVVKASRDGVQAVESLFG